MVVGQLANKERVGKDFSTGGESTYYKRVHNDPQCFLIEDVMHMLFYGYDPILFAESRMTHVKFGCPAVLG